MVSRKRLYGFIALLVVAVVDWLLIRMGRYGLCPSIEGDSRAFCDEIYLRLIEPSIIILVGALAAYVINLFTPKAVFKAWGILSIVLLLILFSLLYIFDEHSFLGPNREQVAWLLSILYIVISIVIIAYKSWRIKS